MEKEGWERKGRGYGMDERVREGREGALEEAPPESCKVMEVDRD